MLKFKSLEPLSLDPASWEGYLMNGDYFTIEYNSGTLNIKTYRERGNEESLVERTYWKIGRPHDSVMPTQVMLSCLTQAERMSCFDNAVG